MSDALVEMLLKEAAPVSPIRGGRRVTALSLLMGFCLAMLFSTESHIWSKNDQGTATTMALQYMQPARVRHFMQPVRSAQPTDVLRRMRQATNGPRQVAVRAETTDSNNFKNGLTIEIKGQPHKVVEFLHVKPGKGAAFVRTKIKNLLTGNTVEQTFKAGEKVDLARMDQWSGQYTYMDGGDCVFMDMETFEESRLPATEELTKFLKEGMNVKVKEWNGKPLDIELPNPYTFEVTYTEPGAKGDTKTGGQLKEATIDTGAVVRVPYFINIGDKIKLDTATAEYKGKEGGGAYK